MERILLVEPAYQNKFPPIGLMKIASFHRQRGDFVEFYKGEPPYVLLSQANRVYITSLFTFHYDITVKCIKHCAKYISKDQIFFGGIAATLLQSEFEQETGLQNIISGQITDGTILGYDCHTNIDLMPLDYDILDDIAYIYPAGDNYFVYTTRGCPRRCEFCAVKHLEPKYETTNNIIEQVSRVDAIYGKKRNLLVMDNNILFSDKLESIIGDIKSLGFNGRRDFVCQNKFELLMNKIRRRITFGVNYSKQIFETIDYIQSFQKRISQYKNIGSKFEELSHEIMDSPDTWNTLLFYEKELIEITEKYRAKPKVIRYVDFNQGIDARLFTEKKAKIISRIPISPFRLAYDSIDESDTFIKSMNIAVRNGIYDFSNYILYNWNDSPEDLWNRLHTAISLYNNFDVKVKAFSFPMKYAPIHEKDRSFIGEKWNKKYLSAINVILNVTKGIVAKELDFFYEAFGKNTDEYFKILTMPDEFIRFRHFFRDNGLIDCWYKLYNNLSDAKKDSLLRILCDAKIDRSIIYENYSHNLNQILILYRLNKSQFDRGDKNSEIVLSEIYSSQKTKHSR